MKVNGVGENVIMVGKLLSFGKDLHPARMHNLLKFSLSVTRDILTEMDNMSTEVFIKIKDFFVENETKIVLIVGFCLVSAISFEFGVLQGQKWQQKPLVIEKPSETQPAQENANLVNSSAQGTTQASAGQALASKGVTAPNMTGLSAAKAGCAFVGSRSSNKFYLPTCSYAKRIKSENLVCFKSAQEALGQGRTESKCK